MRYCREEELLVKTLGFLYVLTAKLNQDCLERFFGVLRQIGGGEDHPSATTFLQLFRLLSIYFPLARVVRGNVSDNTESVKSQTSAIRLLKSMRKERLQELDCIKNELEKDLLAKIDPDKARSSYNGIRIINSVVYDVCGFLAFKRNSFTDCQTCMSTLVSKTANPSAGVFTASRTRGGLCFPSDAMYNLINEDVEPHVAKELINNLHNISPQTIISSIKSIQLKGLGCNVEGHRDKLVSQVVMYYISLRLHFYCSNFLIEKKKTTKKKRKETKLT